MAPDGVAGMVQEWAGEVFTAPEWAGTTLTGIWVWVGAGTTGIMAPAGDLDGATGADTPGTTTTVRIIITTPEGAMPIPTPEDITTGITLLVLQTEEMLPLTGTLRRPEGLTATVPMSEPTEVAPAEERTETVPM